MAELWKSWQQHFEAESRSLDDAGMLQRALICYRLHRSYKSDDRYYEEMTLCRDECNRRRAGMWDEVKAAHAQEVKDGTN